MQSPMDDTPQWMQNGTPNMYMPAGTPVAQSPSQPGLPGTPRADGTGPSMPSGAFDPIAY